MNTINISRSDVIWGYASQVFNVGANLFVLPVVFRFLSSDILGVWYIFVNIATFVTLFGLVFQSSFARNLSYAFSGVTTLLKDGVQDESEVLDEPNYSLVKSLIVVMKQFYGILSVILVSIFLIIGIPYFYHLSGALHCQDEILSSWILYAISIAIGFYSLIFGSILQGRGYIKEVNQLIIFNRLVYIIFVYIFIINGYSILGIALANIASVTIHYVLGFVFAYKNQLKQMLKQVEVNTNNLMKTVWSNTYKLSTATLLIYISTKGNLFYVSLFIPLDIIAQYGLSLQVMNVLTNISLMYFYSYTPMVAQSWVKKDLQTVRQIYSKGLVLFIFIFILISVGVLFWGNPILSLIGSNTTFLSTLPLLFLCVVYFFDSHHTLALNLLVSQNNIPHLKVAIISTLAIFILIPLLVIPFNLGICGVILSVGVVQICCHNWLWPWAASRKLGIGINKQLKLGINILLHTKIRK